MKIVIKTMISFLRKNPAHVILAAVAMIAAASIVAWIVSGYDTILSEFGKKQIMIGDHFHAALMVSEDEPSLDPVLVTKMIADSEILSFSVFTPETKVNLTTNTAKKAEAEKNMASLQNRKKSGGFVEERNGGEKRKRGGGQLSPVVYGLPNGGGVSLQGTDAELPLFKIREGKWFAPENKETLSSSSDKNLNLPEAILSESIASQYHSSVGDIITVASNAGYFQLQVVGVTEDGPSVHSLNFASLNRHNVLMTGVRGIFTRWETAERISGGRQNAATVQFLLKSKDKLNDFLRRWNVEVNETDAILVDSNTIDSILKNTNAGRSQNMSQAYSATALSMLLSFFIILSTLSMGIDEQIRQYAILRMIAFSRKQVVMMILFESLMLGFLGWGGGLLSSVILKIILDSSEKLTMDFYISFRTVFFTGITSIIGSFLAAIYPMIRMFSIRPIDAFGKENSDKRKTSLMRDALNRFPISKKIFLWGIFLLALDPLISFLHGIPELLHVFLYSFIGVPALAIGFVFLTPEFVRLCCNVFHPLVARVFFLHPLFLKAQFKTNHWRISGTVVALSIGLGFYMMLLIWSASMLQPYIPGSWMPELFISVTPGGLNEETSSLVAEIKGVRAGQCRTVSVEQLLLADDVTGSNKRTSVVRQNNIVMLGVDDPENAYYGNNCLFPFHFLSDPKTAIQMMNKNPCSCLLPHYFVNVAINPKTSQPYRVGDTLDVISSGIHGEKVSFVVAGIIEQNGWHWFSKMSGTRRNRSRTAAMIFTTRKAMREKFSLERGEYFWMNLEKDANIDYILASVSNLAETNRGENFHVPGMNGLSVVGRQIVKSTTKKGLFESLITRTRNVVDGMLQLPLLLLWVVSISVANTILASFRARRREIGLMRTTALSSSQVFRLMLAESILIAFSASIISISFGLVSGLCSAQMSAYSQFFGGMGWSFVIPWTKTFQGIGLTILLCFAAALIPAILCGRMKPIDLLSDDSINC